MPEGSKVISISRHWSYLSAGSGKPRAPQRITARRAASYAPRVAASLAPFDDGATPAQLVVLDPSLTDAVDGATVERWRNWARGWGLAPHRIGRLEAWWAP